MPEPAAASSAPPAAAPESSRFLQWLSAPVGPLGVTAVSVYLVVLLVWGLWALFALIQALSTTPAEYRVCLFGPWCALDTKNADVGIALTAAFAGMLGALIHAGTSFTSYMGNRKMIRSWVLWYLFRPFIGAVLSVLVYCIIRGGLLNAGSKTDEDVSIYGVAGFSAMAGMFSKQAIDKLKELFDTLFRTKAKEGDDARIESLTDTGEADADAIAAAAAAAAAKKKDH